jgi:hypothetical protein
VTIDCELVESSRQAISRSDMRTQYIQSIGDRRLVIHGRRLALPSQFFRAGHPVAQITGTTALTNVPSKTESCLDEIAA